MTTIWADNLLDTDNAARSRERVRRFVFNTCKTTPFNSRQVKGWYNIRCKHESHADRVAALFDKVDVKYRRVSTTQFSALLTSDDDRMIQSSRKGAK